ncbi:hypothetical protein QN413_18190 [Variovorax sp. LG9.2]|nr:hypothetical protein [Variovorax sp. LG9.2]
MKNGAHADDGSTYIGRIRPQPDFQQPLSNYVFFALNFFNILKRTEMAALVALLVVSLAAAAFVGTQNYVADAPVLSTPNAAALTFTYAFVIGCGPAFLLGAPLYSALHQCGWATWSAATALGVLPGMLFLLLDAERLFAQWFLVCGLAVALLTHAVNKRWQR